MGIAQTFLCIALPCAAAEPGPDEPAAATIDFYRSAMFAERQKIRSGEFIVSGTKSAKYPTTPERDYSGKMLISCTFDDDRIRMDNLEPAIVAALPLTNPPRKQPGRIERKFFRTPES